MLVWAKAMPRSAIIWTRSRDLSLNVRYHLYAQDDDFLVKVPPFEEILCPGRFRHPSRYRKTPSVSTVCTRTLFRSEYFECSLFRSNYFNRAKTERVSDNY